MPYGYYRYVSRSHILLLLCLRLSKLSSLSTFGVQISRCLHHCTDVSSNSSSAMRYGLVDFFDHLLQQGKTSRQCQQVHSQVLLTGSHHLAFLAARLVSVYAGFGLLGNARRVFETTLMECSPTNSLLWNSILRAHVAYGEYGETLKVYLRMRLLGVGADGFTFPLVLRACAAMGDLNWCQNIHCHALQMGLQYHLHVANELLGMYGKLGQMENACRVFDRMILRSHISWNTMVSGYSINYDCEGALQMFRWMEMEGVEPNIVTWTSLLSSHARCAHCEETLQLYCEMRKRGIGINAEALAVVISVCVDSGAVAEGEAIHGCVIKGGFGNYSFVKNSLVCLYGRHGAIKDAKDLFLEMKIKNIVSWNALISSYAESGFCDEALAIFMELEMSDEYPMLKPNVVSWSAVIGGFASNGRSKEALELFRQMQLIQVLANSITISSVLSVCAELSALGAGREIHGHLIRAMMDYNVLVGNGLINMYTKCGCLNEAHLVFHRLEHKDTISWNSMIAGYGMHGLGENALKTFDQMIKQGYKPDGISFVTILSACSHAGLVAEGHRIFDLMTTEYRVTPQIEHYSCMVDLLGRAGLLQQASSIVRSMPIEPNSYIWGALLNSCKIHKDTGVAEEAASRVSSLGSETPGNYMLLSNMYAADGRWENSAKVRVSAKTKGLKKVPGWSWIEVKKRVYTFSAGNALPTGMNEVYRILKCLGFHMKIEGSYVPQDAEVEVYLH